MEKLLRGVPARAETTERLELRYSPDQGGKLSTVIKNAEGQVLVTYVWSAENISACGS